MMANIIDIPDVVRLVGTACTQAAAVLSAPPEQPRTGEWLVLADDKALAAHSGMEVALQAVRDLKMTLGRNAAPELVLFLERTDNALEYSLATITPSRGGEAAEAHAGRASSAIRQLTAQAMQADELLATVGRAIFSAIAEAVGSGGATANTSAAKRDAN